VSLFLGGPSGPRLGFLDRGGWVNVWIVPVFWFLLKLWIVLYGTVWVRASLPRLRYDRLMELSWKLLIEAAFLWAMLSGVIVVGADRGWNLWITVPLASAAALLVFGFLMACVPRPGELEEIR
jgi:NADH-quinone oxidoreductase subunit H